MFVKVTESGPRRYIQLVESFRDDAGRVKKRTVATLGRLDQLHYGALGFATGDRRARRKRCSLQGDSGFDQWWLLHRQSDIAVVETAGNGGGVWSWHRHGPDADRDAVDVGHSHLGHDLRALGRTAAGQDVIRSCQPRCTRLGTAT